MSRPLLFSLTTRTRTSSVHRRRSSWLGIRMRRIRTKTWQHEYLDLRASTLNAGPTGTSALEKIQPGQASGWNYDGPPTKGCKNVFIHSHAADCDACTRSEFLNHLRTASTQTSNYIDDILSPLYNINGHTGHFVGGSTTCPHQLISMRSWSRETID